jgi:hypothetical protein
VHSSGLGHKKLKPVPRRRRETEDERKAREEEEAFMSEAYRIVSGLHPSSSRTSTDAQDCMIQEKS